MYSVENPAFKKQLNSLEQVQYGQRFTGVGAQILGPNDEYLCQYTEESPNFWGSKFTKLILNAKNTSFHKDKCFSLLRQLDHKIWFV